MKTKYILIALLLGCAFCGCDKYFAPDDFPKSDFYSYLPYVKGDIVKLSNGNETKEFVVTEVQESYYRGKDDGSKGGIEQVGKTISLTYNNEQLFFSIFCTERAIFYINIENIDMQKGDLAKITYEVVNYSNEDVWSKSYDKSKIFKAFTNKIELKQNDATVAEIEKEKGILWFTDLNSKTWQVSR